MLYFGAKAVQNTVVIADVVLLWNDTISDSIKKS